MDERARLFAKYVYGSDIMNWDSNGNEYHIILRRGEIELAGKNAFILGINALRELVALAGFVEKDLEALSDEGAG